MKFRRLVKTVDTTNYYEKMIDPKKLKAQYNPERVHMWRSLHKGPKKEVLNMRYSPHYKYLRGHKEAYRKLQRYYGRNNRWIKNKIHTFISVFESISKEGFKGSVVVLETPLVKNSYNQGFEIYEGHHRVACALVLGIEKISCEVIRRKNENN